jgi:uncharacterized protein (DUF302 family)
VDPAAVSLRTQISPHSVAESVERLLDALDARGIAVFARVDHAAGARDAGLELDDEVIVIFGDPRVGTPLMQEDASVGYELPLRLLVWDSGDGQTTVGWRPPTELASDYDLSGHAEVLQRMEGLLEQLAAEITAA